MSTAVLPGTRNIDEFFAHKRYALVEIDPTSEYGRAVYERLKEGGREVAIVMAVPSARALAVAGVLYRSVADVPGSLDGVVLNIENDPRRLEREVRAAAGKGVPRIWIENRCLPGGAVAYAMSQGMEVVDNVCALLALDLHHVHWLHRKALDHFGKTPRVQYRVAA